MKTFEEVCAFFILTFSTFLLKNKQINKLFNFLNIVKEGSCGAPSIDDYLAASTSGNTETNNSSIPSAADIPAAKKNLFGFCA